MNKNYRISYVDIGNAHGDRQSLMSGVSIEGAFYVAARETGRVFVMDEAESYSETDMSYTVEEEGDD